MKNKASDKNIIITKKEKKNRLEEIAIYRDNLRKKPFLRSLFIEMTLNCNEHCRHCGSSCGDVKMQDQLTDEEIKNVLYILKTKTTHLPFLNITGGEPLLREGLIDIMTYAHEIGYNWGMTSNGLLIDDEMARKLKEAGMYSVSISLDGLKDTHDWFRQRKGSYEETIAAINRLVKVGFGNVMVTTVVHKKNIDELDEIYKVVKQTKCDTWRIINVDPIGRALKDASIRLDTMDYKRVLDFIEYNRAKDSQMEIAFGCNHYLGPKREKELRPWYFMCTAGIQTAGILYNGDISACLDIERTPFNIQGNIKQDDLYDTWINKFQVYRRDRTIDSEKCGNCKHKRFCQGGGYHTWDSEKKEPRICMLEQLKLAKKLKKMES